MKCYGQIIYESGSYAYPMPDDYQEWDSITEAKDSLARTWNDLDVDPVNGLGVTLHLWAGQPDEDDLYPCDSSAVMPDYVFELGPRGGVRASQ
jgi:hypothetical protein